MLTPFFKLLRNDEIVLVTPELLEKFTAINMALDRCCELALKQPLPNKQIALMTDDSFMAAGYAVLIEDDPRKIHLNEENFCSGGLRLQDIQSRTVENVHLR